eukprot:GHVR01091609.1.p1 GENE.GHVR01091609.1~~GHVR01091609.1.p1  ORF type:complete len:110 (-),score=28.25 GHVR01091609.1:8-337(-)
MLRSLKQTTHTHAHTNTQANMKQCWFADDSSAAVPLNELREWFELLRQEGPKFGYYPEPNKCKIIVNQNCIAEAKETLGELGVQVVEGGGIIGSPETTRHLATSKKEGW